MEHARQAAGQMADEDVQERLRGWEVGDHQIYISIISC